MCPVMTIPSPDLPIETVTTTMCKQQIYNFPRGLFR
jgi:hypothetical protein